MKKVTEVTRNGIPYEVTAIYDGSSMVGVYVYRIRRPKWKIFRTDLFSIGSKYFFIVDYPTIEAGVNDTVNKILRKAGIIEGMSQKLKDYFDN
jgi:hypothetical protein